MVSRRNLQLTTAKVTDIFAIKSSLFQNLRKKSIDVSGARFKYGKRSVSVYYCRLPTTVASSFEFCTKPARLFLRYIF